MQSWNQLDFETLGLEIERLHLLEGKGVPAMAKRERLTRSLSKDVFERRMSIGGGLFELFGRDSEQIPGEIVLIKEKRLTNTH